MYDFANILFAGPCNRSCPFCIGKELPDRLNEQNLDVFPLRGLQAFVETVNRHGICQIVFTGTTSDPQLYRYEGELLALLREQLHPGARFSIHTNGVRTLKKLEVFNRYDRACLSLPTLDARIYEKMMGSRQVPDLAAILQVATVPVKVSAVVSEHNAHDIEQFVEQCWQLGVKRLVVRKLFGETRTWNLFAELPVAGEHRGNPVYDFRGMELTYWDFHQASSTSINLFADGTLSGEYLLTETVRAGAARAGSPTASLGSRPY